MMELIVIALTQLNGEQVFLAVCVLSLTSLYLSLPLSLSLTFTLKVNFHYESLSLFLSRPLSLVNFHADCVCARRNRIAGQ